jgi:site-specific recombinase
LRYRTQRVRATATATATTTIAAARGPRSRVRVHPLHAGTLARASQSRVVPMASRLAPLFALFARDPGRSRLDELCEFAPVQDAQEDLVFWLVRLVAWLRPKSGERAGAKLRFLHTRLAQHPEWRARVARALGTLLRQSDVDHALAYAGIPRHFHFGGAVREWVHARALPTACRTSDAGQILRLAFDAHDASWIGTPAAVALVRDLVDDATLSASLERALRDALVDLAHQIVAQAHTPTVRALARAERSPYRGLHDAVAAVDARPDDDDAFVALRGRLRQCALLLRAHHAELAERGADLNTTFQLARLGQQLARLDLLATLRHRGTDAALGDVLAALVREVARQGSGQRLVARSVDLVVQNLVDTTATVGRAYLHDERSSWRAAFLAGAGGGALMAAATVVKCFVARLHLPALYEGLAFSLNYAAAFCAAYLLHFTIATKLPAHTAAALARAVQTRHGHRARLQALLAVWRSTARLQLAGLAGNVAVAGPLAYAMDVALARATGRHVVSLDKAAHLLSANSLAGPSVLYAALTGLFLWISSLVGAAADNWTRTTQLTDRLVTNPFVMQRLGAHRARGYAEAFVARVGGLLGNLSLGFLLGAVPAAFAIAHLPVEIRHVTVSTGSVALALASGAGTRGSVALAVLGLVVIAAVNVAVSFVLALWLALRATHGTRAPGSSAALVRLGIRWWITRDARARATPATAPADRAP